MEKSNEWTIITLVCLFITFFFIHFQTVFCVRVFFSSFFLSFIIIFPVCRWHCVCVLDAWHCGERHYIIFSNSIAVCNTHTKYIIICILLLFSFHHYCRRLSFFSSYRLTFSFYTFVWLRFIIWRALLAGAFFFFVSSVYVSYPTFLLVYFYVRPFVLLYCFFCRRFFRHFFPFLLLVFRAIFPKQTNGICMWRAHFTVIRIKI